VDTVLVALGAARRREILGLLRCGERAAGEIHRALGDVTFGAVSQHLGVLERAGLVQVRREGAAGCTGAARGPGAARRWLDSWDDALFRLARLSEAEATRGSKGRRRRVR
jgi:DNA-binding transcriptional ArsR family regulator